VHTSLPRMINAITPVGQIYYKRHDGKRRRKGQEKYEEYFH